LLTTAACGGLRSTPDCRPRRTYLHLSYSYAPPCGPALLVHNAITGREQVQQTKTYSITSSAMASKVGGTTNFSALVVLRLITINFDGLLYRQIGRLLAFENAAGIKTKSA